MKQFVILAGVYCLALGASTRTHAHGLPIDVFANAATGRMFVFENFESGDLVLTPGIDISADAPGIGVNYPTNGIAPGTPFGVDVTQELLYWNGNSLAVPTVELWLDNPAQTDFYTVSATSGEQTGLSWATYPGGSLWDAHGLFSLSSLSAPVGIYGVAIRITSPDYDSTKPFLLPLVYDPNSQWTVQQLNEGVDLLREAIDVPASGDFDASGSVGGSDFLVWQRNYDPSKSFSVTHAHGDADLDSDIDAKDLGFWSEQYGSVVSGFSQTMRVIPEPTCCLLAMLGSSLLSFSIRLFR